MKTTIDNNQRKFLIYLTGWSSQSYVCNLKDIPLVLKEIEKHQPYKIAEVWNNKLSLCSKKHLNEIFEANKIEFRIK